MKVYSTLIAFFLVFSNLPSTRVSAQAYGTQPASELEASQEAYRLGEETRRNELPTSEVEKGEGRSTTAMHWSFVNQSSQHVPNDSDKAVNGKKLAASEQINQPAKITE